MMKNYIHKFRRISNFPISLIINTIDYYLMTIVGTFFFSLMYAEASISLGTAFAFCASIDFLIVVCSTLLSFFLLHMKFYHYVFSFIVIPVFSYLYCPVGFYFIWHMTPWFTQSKPTPTERSMYISLTFAIIQCIVLFICYQSKRKNK